MREILLLGVPPYGAALRGGPAGRLSGPVLRAALRGGPAGQPCGTALWGGPAGRPCGAALRGPRPKAAQSPSPMLRPKAKAGKSRKFDHSSTELVGIKLSHGCDFDSLYS